MIGTVLSGTNNFFTVNCEDLVLRTCSIKGKKLKASQGYYNPLAPGDVVIIEVDSHDNNQAQIIDVNERKNVFLRWNVKGRSPQLLASNLDYVLCVATPDYPPFRPRFVDRLLAQAEEADIEPIIIINKSDLDFSTETNKRIHEWERIGYTVLKTSAQNHTGIDELAKKLHGKISAFVGQSGVGKSSIINALDSEQNLRVGELSDKYERGTHTTTKGVLLTIQTLAGAVQVVDTPGVRRFVLHNIPGEDLALYFKEMSGLVGQCTYGMSCSHTHEKGCKILEAVENGQISDERYESWERIKDEITNGTWAD